ncbi:uncharacterized protein LOC105216007 [Zeugodacus cucurbitae]|uniref:uncharacterized protein LOC105216007 n=1 Tax=Zeugodacus cucurbitae TaxID=28588 RepID=UPI0023D963E5|nr:uncharacterized protein LOC105216007 [Zeugodacus cucurbitae]
MAQFVVITSIFLYASCFMLLCAAQVPQQQYQQQLQQQTQLTKVPLVSDNVAEMLVAAGVQANVGAGAGVGVAGGVGGIVAPSVGSVAEEKEVERVYHPAAVTKPRIIDQYDHRSLDGHFEYRYLLSNGEARYERAYWLPAGKSMVLARKGYYSYPLSHDKYLTVFYTADQNGFRQDSTTYSRTQPHLPRSIEVPEYVPQTVYAANEPVTQRPPKPHVHASTTTPRPFVPSTSNPFLQLKPTPVPHVSAHQAIVGHGQHLHGHQSQTQHSSVHSSSAAHSSAGGHVASAAHSSTGGHHSAGVHAASVVSSSSGGLHSVGSKPVSVQVWHSQVGVPSSSSSPSVHHSSGIHTQSGVHLAVPNQSAVHSASGGHYAGGSHSQAGAHYNIPIQSAVHASSGVHSSLGGHLQAGVQSEVPVASAVHSSVGAYPPPPVHVPSVHQTSTGAPSTVVPHFRPTVRPSNQVHSSHQYQSASQGSSAGVHPTVASPTAVPIQSWHYSF